MNETKIAKWHLCPSLGTQISEQWATSFFNHWACSELQRSSVAVIWVFSWPATLPFLVAGSGSCVGRQGFLGSRGAKINIKTTDLGSNLGAFISYPHGLGWITSVTLGQDNGFGAPLQCNETWVITLKRTSSTQHLLERLCVFSGLDWDVGPAPYAS